MSPEDRERRLARTVCGVVLGALRDSGARRLFLVDDGSPEASLCARWLSSGLPAGTVHTVTPPVTSGNAHRGGEGTGPGVESPLQRVAPDEGARALARSLASAEDGVVAGPANRTTLLLAPDAAPDRVLPLGDLWASRVAELAGGWSGPAAVRELAERLGGVQRLDRALADWVSARPLDLPEAAERELLASLRRAQSARRWPRLVPKLENRTMWMDLGR
ncbi:MAG TPA: hypothetical protein VK837_13365 [Longimicrobiales bacterium]|nr:hypothetical protein [Longimicrobiales bacterium]